MRAILHLGFLLAIMASFAGDASLVRMQIEITAENLEKLRAEPREYVRANITAPGETIRDAGIHLKGTGSFQTLDEKPSFTIDFRKYVSKQRFGDFQKIHLNNSVQDPSHLREFVGGKLFREAGIPVPRVSHALVELNGRVLGLYVLKEGFTDDFIGRSFGDHSGTLYEPEKGHDIDGKLKRRAGSVPSERNLVSLVAAMKEANPGKRWVKLQDAIDTSQFITFMALEVMICHWDGYCLGKNNFRLYHPHHSGSVYFLPSGMDQLFSNPQLPWTPDMSGLLARAVMQTPEGRQKYQQRFRQLFLELFDSKNFNGWIDTALRDLRPHLTISQFEALQKESDALREGISRRARNLREQLDAPEAVVPRFINGRAVLAGWTLVDASDAQKQVSPEAEKPLDLMANGRTFASWRTTIQLKRGAYRFQARVKTTDVSALPFGNFNGASLRVHGSNARSAALLGTNAGQILVIDFEVESLLENVGLICELRALTGKARFEDRSLIEQHDGTRRAILLTDP